MRFVAVLAVHSAYNFTTWPAVTVQRQLRCESWLHWPCVLHGAQNTAPLVQHLALHIHQ